MIHRDNYSLSAIEALMVRAATHDTGNPYAKLAPMPPPHPKVAVRVLTPFYLGGKLQDVDNVCELPLDDAESGQAIGRCKILE